ncbi:MAG: glutamyl-tRNA reductase [Flavobacteriales bacterium Tduv]
MKNFYLVSLDYRTADAATRGRYSLVMDKGKNIRAYSNSKGVNHFFAVSTCNRTEFYAFADRSQDVIKLFFHCTQGDINELRKLVTIKREKAAIDFLFRVGAGLESQILGDFEITGQLKKWFSFFKKSGTTNTFLERLVNSVLQAGKLIKSETRLSSGATSVSYAAVRHILEKNPDVSNKNILLFGTGKIGRNTCENLVKHTEHPHITLINRTKKKAELLASKYQIEVKDHADLQEVLAGTDILIVATGADKPTITSSMLTNREKELLIIDLSIPENVERSVTKHPHTQLLNTDALTRQVDDTLEQRKNEIPKAESIIEDVKEEFLQWIYLRQYAPTIQAFKESLGRIYEHEKIQYLRKNPIEINEESLIVSGMIQRITNRFAQYLHTHVEEADKGMKIIQKMFHLNP